MKILIVIALLALGYAISWAICVGLVYLISLCFPFDFSLLMATGVWLILCLIKFSFSNKRKNK